MGHGPIPRPIGLGKYLEGGAISGGGGGEQLSQNSLIAYRRTWLKVIA
jgi:hypothetical protein